MNLLRIVAAAVAGALLLAACGDSTGGDAGRGDGAIEHPTGADDVVVVRVEVVGGFGGGPAAADQPLVSVFGDGTVVVPGPEIQIYPPPALPNLQTTNIGGDGVETLLEDADALGLLQPGIEYGQPTITDQATTTVTIAAGGEVYDHRAYALGLGGGHVPTGGITDEQLEARARLAEFVDVATGAATRGDGAFDDYRPDALAVISDAYANLRPRARVEPNTIDWPLGDLASAGQPFERGGRCVTVSGDELEPVLAAADRATTITEWRSGGQIYALTFVPLLPDEQRCDD